MIRVGAQILLALLGDQQLLLRGNELRAIDREEGLVLLDELADEIHKHTINPAFEFRVDVSDSGFVVSDLSNRAPRLADWRFRDRSVLHSDQLLFFRTDPD